MFNVNGKNLVSVFQKVSIVPTSTYHEHVGHGYSGGSRIQKFNVSEEAENASIAWSLPTPALAFSLG
jgi:hypothetical protein